MCVKFDCFGYYLYRWFVDDAGCTLSERVCGGVGIFMELRLILEGVGRGSVEDEQVLEWKTFVEPGYEVTGGKFSWIELGVIVQNARSHDCGGRAGRKKGLWLVLRERRGFDQDVGVRPIVILLAGL